MLEAELGEGFNGRKRVARVERGKRSHHLQDVYSSSGENRDCAERN